MAKVVDDDSYEVMRQLPPEWKMKRFDRLGPGWVARITNGATEFQLVSEYFYIHVEQIIDGKPRFVIVPERLRNAFPRSRWRNLFLNMRASYATIP